MSKPKSIMIVEDEVITQRYLKDILGTNGVTILGAYDSGEKALEALSKTSCDIVLLDINLKGAMDGLRLARYILDKYTTCIVFISAYCDKRTVEEAAELSPYGFIVKPFSPNDVEVAIASAYKRFLEDQKKPVKEPLKLEDRLIVIDKKFKYSFKDAVLFYNDETIDLSMRQNKLVGLLCRNMNSIVSNEAIVSEIWRDKNVSNTSLRTLVYNIRKLAPELPLKSHSKLGYMISSNIT